MDFGEFLLWTLWIFLFIAYLMILWIILTDLFRDDELSGWWKALWIIALIIFPFLTALIYMIARGKGMQQRKIAEMKAMKEMQDDYIKNVAGTSQTPTEQIAHAKQLLDSGAITQEEFDALKAKALARA